MPPKKKTTNQLDQEIDAALSSHDDEQRMEKSECGGIQPRQQHSSQTR